MECRICDIEMLTRVMRRRGRSTLVGRQFAANYHLVEIAPPSSYCRPHNLKQDDIEYAIENTQVILAPERQIAVLRYGFQFRKSGVTEETVSASLQSVIDRTRRSVESAGDPNGAIIQGVDEAWEVCLLKFTIEMIERSAGENIGDFKRRGLI